MRAEVVIPAGPSRSGQSVYPPVLPRGPLLVAQRLRSLGYDSRTTDYYSFPIAARQDAIGKIEECDLLAISVHGAPGIAAAISVALAARKHQPELPILFGGNLPRVSPESLLSYLPPRSAIVCGADPSVLRESIEYLVCRDAAPRIFRETVRAPDAEEWSLASTDCLVPSIKAYLSHPDFEYHLSTQEGCPYRCFHCGTGRSGLFGRVHYRPIGNLYRELDGLHKICASLGVALPRLWITDETFGSNQGHARAVAELLEHSGVKWQWRAQTRLDCFDEESFRHFARAGCYKLAFGVEIPTTAGLQLLGKREEMAAAATAFRAARSVSVKSEAILVLSTPGDTASLAETADALEQLGADSVQSYIYHPVPGSPWWRLYHPQGVPDVEWWTSLDFHSLPIMLREEDFAMTLATFLAFQLWRPGRGGSVAQKIDPQTFSCAICDESFSLTLLLTLAQTLCFEVRSTTSETIVAWNPIDAEAMVIPRKVNGNLHAALIDAYPVCTMSELANIACPKCLSSTGEREVA